MNRRDRLKWIEDRRKRYPYVVKFVHNAYRRGQIIKRMESMGVYHASIPMMDGSCVWMFRSEIARKRFESMWLSGL